MKRLTIGVLTLLCLLLAACAGEVENSSAEESLAASEGVSSVQSFDASSDEESLVSVEEPESIEPSESSEESEPAEPSEESEPVESSEESVPEESSDPPEESEPVESSEESVPEESSDPSDDPIEPVWKPTTGEEWENLFWELYGFHPDFFQILNTASYQKLAEVWMDNPIDQWGYAYAQLAMTTGDMVALEETVTANWLREIEESIAYIKKWYPEYGASLEEEHIIWKEAVQLRADLPLELMRYADNFGTLQLVYHAGDISALYRERAFQLLYEEFHCKESVDDKSHEIGLEMIVPEGMEVELEEGRFSGGFGDFYWACETESFEEDYVLDNPIDAWEREFLADYDIFLSDIDLGDVMIANWKREIEEATALILDCYPEMEELLAREAIAWKQGIFGHSPLSLVLDTGYYGTLHLMLDEDVAVYQYRRRALHLLHLAVACVELQEYTGRTTDLVPELTFVMPEL